MSSSANDRIRVGLVGLGYWGPNLARNLARSEQAELAYLCDLSVDLHDKYRSSFPGATFTTDYEQLLGDDTLDAIVLASPVPTHYKLGCMAVDAGKHTFIEKPIALTAADAADLVERAEARNVRLMVGHLLEYHPAVLKVKDLIDSGELGDVLYAYSNRLNLGQFRRDENALWSLGVHDVATLLFLLGGIAPTEVSARGESYLHDGVEDVVFGDMRFANGVMAHIHLSWLDPHKMRKLTVVGSQQMVVFDDMQADRKVTVYDKGFSRAGAAPGSGSWGEYISKREGDIHIPRISGDEPLRIEVEHFLHCVATGATPRSDGRDGLRVVQVLEGMQQSLEQGGAPVALGTLARA